MKSLKYLSMLILIQSISVGAVSAGPYANKLSQCFVDSTTIKEKEELVRWLFSIFSVHPAIKPIATVTPQQIEKANKNVAGIYMRLVTNSCKQQTRNTLKHEGEAAVVGSFNTLGQIAGKDIFGNTKVADAMNGMFKYLDVNELKRNK